MGRQTTTKFLVIAIAILSCWNCSEPERTYPNAPVILISVDTLRSDHLPVYGYDGLQTPGIDSLAKDSLIFDRAYAHVPLTLPSHASMLTGLLPTSHGVRDNTGFALDTKFTTLAEQLQQAGYATAGFISGMVLRQSTGISKGFDFYEDDLDTQSENRIRRYAFRRGNLTTNLAKDWIARNDGKPFFMFLHLYDPHTPYDPPPPFGARARSPYDGEIAYVDSLMEDFFKFLKKRGIYDRAIIVFTSDHGEGLGEHGEDEHGILAYREGIQVPMIVKMPGSALAGQRRSQPVGLFDITPSILASLDLEAKAMDGVSIFGQSEPAAKRPIYSETLSPLQNFGWCATRGVILDELHYLQICDPELYDLSKDFKELNDILGERKVPGAILDELERLGEGLKTEATNTAEELELLASLGYAGGSVVFSADKALDPRTEIKVFAQLDEARALLQAKEFEKVTDLLVPILERNPAMSDGRYMLIQALTEQGKLAEAEYATLEGLGLFPNHLNFLMTLANLKLKLGQKTEAVKAATKAFELDADTAGAQLLLPLYDGGGASLAVQQAQKIIDRFSDSALSAPYAYFVLGREARDRGDLPGAVQFLQKGLALRERIHKKETLGYAHQAIGDSLARMDRLEEALDHLLKAVELVPNYTNARVALSYVYASMQRPREAVEVMNNWVRQYPTPANFERAAQAMDTMGLKQQAQAYRDAASQAQKTPQ